MAEGTLGVVTVLLGMIAVATVAAVVHRAGKVAGALTLPVALAGGTALAGSLGGRPGLSDFALGALIGLPVLVAVLLPAAREERQPRAQGAPRRRVPA
jgi:hypothetical protein